MVEKIIISPESIRGLGNIVMPKTGADFEEYNCTMEVSEDTVNGETVTVYVLTPETTTISLVLSSSVDSCGIGDSVVLSVTVTEDSVPVSGASVSFKLAGAEVGTGTTNSSGVATYTYTATDVGSLNFTSVYAGHSSNSVSVVVSHDYSIAFDSSSYSTSDGSVTCYVTLLDNSVAVSGASISLTGTGSTLSATTNSSGVATFNLTGISADCTITATYGSVFDTATITVASYIINDDASADNQSTLFGNSIALRSSGSNTTAWNSSGYYTIKTQSSGSRESMRVIAPLTGVTDAFCIEWDSYCEGAGGSSGLVVYNSSTSWEKLTDNANTLLECWTGYNNGSYHETKYYLPSSTNQKWVHYKFTVNGNQFNIKIIDGETTLWDRTETMHFTPSSTTQYGFNSEWEPNRVMRYKNIVAYKI